MAIVLGFYAHGLENKDSNIPHPEPPEGDNPHCIISWFYQCLPIAELASFV